MAKYEWEVTAAHITTAAHQARETKRNILQDPRSSVSKAEVYGCAAARMGRTEPGALSEEPRYY